MARITNRSDSNGGGGLKRTFAIACVLVLGVAVTAWGWRLVSQDPADIPVIQAETGTYKITPADPGGKQVPYADSELYETINPDEYRERVELSPDNRDWSEDLERLTTQEPDPVDLIEQAAREQEEQQQEADTKVAATTTQPAEPEPLTQDERAEPQPEPIAEVIEPEPVVETVPEQILESIIQSQVYQVQLGALPSQAQVREEWTRIQQKHKSDLDALTLDIQAAGGDTGLFRLRAGALSSYGEASELCARLSAKGQDCLVVTQ